MGKKISESISTVEREENKILFGTIRMMLLKSLGDDCDDRFMKEKFTILSNKLKEKGLVSEQEKELLEVLNDICFS